MKTTAEDRRALQPRRAFLDPTDPHEPLDGIADDADFRHGVVMQLRSAHARYPHDPAVTGLVDDLRRGSADFARLWERHDVQAPPMLTKTFQHPAVGPVTVDCDVLLLPDRDQHLVLYTAPQGSSDARALALLGVLGADRAGAEHPT